MNLSEQIFTRIWSKLIADEIRFSDGEPVPNRETDKTTRVGLSANSAHCGFSELLPSHRRDARTSICDSLEQRFRSLLRVPLLSERIHDADDRVAAFVRPTQLRDKNRFPHTRNTAGFTEWHMPLVPATIVKRNAVMWNSWSRGR